MRACCLTDPINMRPSSPIHQPVIRTHSVRQDYQMMRVGRRPVQAGCSRLPLVDLIAMRSLGRMPFSGHSPGPAIDPEPTAATKNCLPEAASRIRAASRRKFHGNGHTDVPSWPPSHRRPKTLLGLTQRGGSLISACVDSPKSGAARLARKIAVSSALPSRTG